MARRRGALGLLLDLLFPPACFGCHRRGEWLCADCRRDLPRLGPDGALRAGVGGLAASWSAYAFDGALRGAIHRLKYAGARHYAEPLGELLADSWVFGEMAGARADVVVPVPLHPRRESERGYNQSLLLARELGADRCLPVDDRALQRTRDTASQTRLSAAKRRENVAGAFQAERGRVAGRRVLLVDDVQTTGSTLAECAAALRRAGATEVWAVTVARAR
jgi:competence protein ComFC